MEQQVMEQSKNQVEAKVSQSTIAVIGQGYVGLPLALNAIHKGYTVYGIDVMDTKIDKLKSGKTVISDLTDGQIKAALETGRLNFTTDFSGVVNASAILICVPTPLTKTKDPDLTYITESAKSLAPHLQRGQLVVLESTTYPGTTEEVLIPILETSGLKAEQDFFVAFSPERIDPGNEQFKVSNTPKVVGGDSERSRELAAGLYTKLIGNVVTVSSTKAAEMSKLLENIFRSVNIALVNELLLLCERMDINVWEVIDAAATKPFGYMAFYPGPGLGGHCIPIDPFYLSWKAREYDFHTEFIELAGKINSAMPRYVASRVIDALNHSGLSAQGATILILGMAYKKDVDDLRASPALDVAKELATKGAYVSYHDPFIPHVSVAGLELDSVELTSEALSQADCVVIVTDHSNVDYDLVARESKLIFDTRNVMERTDKSGNIVRL